MRLLRILLAFLTLAVLAVLFYQIPAVNSRLSWRLEGAWAYVRGVIDPIEDAPTPIPQAASETTPTATLAPTPTSPGPTETPLPSPTPLPDAIALPAPDWEKQDWNNCGPASLSLYLKFYGWEGDQYDISNLIKPERPDKNVNVEELVYYASNYAGWLQNIFRVGGDIDTLKELIANGIPVMIEEGDQLDGIYWPDDDQWAGHYLLLTGYDQASQSFIGQDTFRGPDRQVTYAETDERWQAFNRVYIVIYHPNQEEIVKSILGPHWDEEYNRQHALEAAQAETESDPENAFAWFNLGSNLVYFERYAEAGRAYDQARALSLPQRMYRYQFGPFFAYFHANRNEDLLAILDYALRITDDSEEAWLWQGWALYRQGDEAGAVAAFREAYWANTLSPDAQYALEFMGASP
jgi:tetratricopeptide (TPR) repeat protein